MRWPRHPHHHHHHHPDSPQPSPWLLLFVGLFAACVSASASVNSGGEMVCGTPFTDTESSALLADIVLEGRVRQKVFPKKSPEQGFYNVTIQVRKQVWKGRELLNRGKKARKLQLGTFLDAPQEQDSPAVMANDVVSVVEDSGDDAPSCVGQVEDGATYIFFLRQAGDLKGRYFQISALPVKKTRRESRKVSKILKKKAAQKPVIQKLKAPRKVTSESSLTLRCKAKAKPVPIYSWFHNGQPLTSGRGLRIKSNKRGSRLKINKAKGESAGVYTCMAANALGEASKNVTVKVIEAESIHKPCEKQTFCFNGGSCRYLPDLQQTFCQCPRSYEGKRCEKEVAHPVKGASTLEYERVLIIVGIVIAFLVFIVICIASYFLAKRRRERWETRKRMRKMQRERNPLLDQTDGIQQPRSHPVEKETQTDDTHHPPDLPPKREHGHHRANYTQSNPPPPHPPDTPFHMDRHFPLITPTTATTTHSSSTTSPPAGANNGRKTAGRPGSREMERRESRSRLKAVSVDENCKDRPPSWRAEDNLAGWDHAPPLVRRGHGDCPEVIEMDDLSPGRMQQSSPGPGRVSESSPGPGRVSESSPSPDPSPSPGDQVEGLPGFLSSFSSPGDRDHPIRMDTPPKDNAHAQLKTPEEQSRPPPSATADYDIPKPSAVGGGAAPFPQRGVTQLSPLRNASDGPVLALNGLLPDSDSENEDDAKMLLPPLHISEEDLNGNLSKADSMDSHFLPSAPTYSSEDASSPSGSCPTPPIIVGAPPPRHQPPGVVGVDGILQDSFRDDDCGGFLPHAFRGSAEDCAPPRKAYSFDPRVDSDPEDVDQFMHGSPKKSPGGFSAGDIQQDYERRLRKVRADQEAIPI